MGREMTNNSKWQNAGEMAQQLGGLGTPTWQLVTPVLKDLMPFLASTRTWCTYIHTCKIPIYIYKPFFFKKIKNKSDVVTPAFILSTQVAAAGGSL